MCYIIKAVGDVMDNRLIIFELNRKKVSLEKLKKSLLIENDDVLIKKLLFLLEQGIDQLKTTSILSNNIYILRIIDYLNYYPKEKTNSSYQIICEKLKTKIQNTNRKYKDYYQFLQKILRNLENSLNNKSKTQHQKTTVSKAKTNIQVPSFYKEKKYINFFDSFITYIINLNSLSSFFPAVKIGKKMKHFIDISYNLNHLNNMERILENIIQLIQKKIGNYSDSNYDHYLISLEKEIKKIQILLTERKKSVQLNMQKKYHKLVVYEKYLDRYKKECENCFIHIPQIIIDPKNEEDEEYIITIDSKETKDLDDAVSISKGQYGTTFHVYISDVRDYLTQNISEYAFYHASSIYLKNCSYHMLPKVIAENYASLIAGEPRKVLKYSFYIDLLGNISYQCSPEVIHVSERFTYHEVDKILENTCEDPKKEETFHLLYQTMSSLSDKLDYPFMHEGTPTSKSNQIVSNYAVLMNRFVAEDCLKNNFPLIYRNYSDDEHYYSLTNYEEIPYCKITSPIRRYSDTLNEKLYGYFKFYSDIDDHIYDQIEKQLNQIIPSITKTELLHKDISKIMEQKKKILEIK